MNDSIRPYLFDAVNLLKSNVSLLLIPTIIVFAPYLFMLSSDHAFGNILSFVSVFFLFIIYPLIYGKFIAIINGTRTVSWGQLFTLHWWNYFIVKSVVYSPAIFLTLVNLLFDLQIHLLVGTASIITDVLAIYIFPIVFIEHQRFASIPLGVKCLLGNFKFSFPLIFIIILPIFFGLITRNASMHSGSLMYQLLLVFPHWVFSLFIDFTVFLTASMILKNKLYQN